MISFYTGVPGSGKTYSAVNIIFNNFSDHKDAKKDIKKGYLNCYTNINGFKFGKVTNVYKLDFDILESHIIQLHRLYKKKASDDELIELCKELDLYKTFFAIDEVQNFFDANKPHLVWWLTYHRHLFHDIILITQNLSLIHPKYKPLAEFFYRAKPKSLVLFSGSFKYTSFIDSRMSQVSKVGVISVKKRKEIFDLYTSGDSVEAKNVLFYFLSISFGFLLLFFIGGYFFYDFNAPPSSAKVLPISHETTPIPIPSEPVSNHDRVYKRIFCSLEECSIDERTFPINVFNKLFEPYNVVVLDRKVMIEEFREIHILIDKNYDETLVSKSDKEKSFGSGFDFMDFKTGDSDVSGG